jgi:putative ATP-dependent endonuclease of OLD family
LIVLLTRLVIENFRGIVNVDLELERVTVLIGENNSGKSSVLEALHACMNRGLTRKAMPFSEFDFHLKDDKAVPSDAAPISARLTYEESPNDEWPDEIAQAFPNVIQTLADGRQRITFRVTAGYDKALRDFVADWAFLDKDGNVLPTARQPKLVIDLQQLAPVFLLNAVRDASQQFQPRAPFWGPFTKNLQMSDERRAEIEGQIEEINRSILDSHKPFDVVKEKIARAGTLLPLAPTDLVSIEAVPARIFDMLTRTQVKLAARTGAKLPIGQHGAGTQSLSVLFLFEAFLQSRLAEAYDERSEPLLALEEPESHLHPSAIRALWPVLNGLAGQKVIATHSGDLLAAVPLTALRRLSRRNGVIKSFRIDPARHSTRDLEKVAYHVRAKRGSLMFARCWLLVEGETDFSLIPEFAQILGHDLDLCGVSCVEFSQCFPPPLIKVAQDLGIEWHLLTDGDAEGLKYVNAATPLLGADPAADRITRLKETDIEHCLWHHGYQAFYESAVDAAHKPSVRSLATDPHYPTETIKAAIASASKPQLAYAVVAEVRLRGPAGVPVIIKDAIDRAVALAGRSA